MNHVDKQRRGFTIIELMLAMSFISVLLIAIAMTVIHVSTIYTKGLTLKEVNQTGREVSEDLRRSIAASGRVELATDFAEVMDGATVVGGRLCLGSSSYIWNYGRTIEAKHVRLTKYLDAAGNPTDTPAIRFIKVPDGAKKYCSKDGSGKLLVPNVSLADKNQARELLREGDRTLSLHSMKLATNDAAFNPATGQRLFRVTYTLGTERTDLLNLGATPISCKTPKEIGSDLNYCTVQEFSLVVRAGGGV